MGDASVTALNRVIVVGAGPVGLTAALVLANAGVPVTVLEKRATLSPASKASTFHPPTLAILDDLGILNEVLDQGAVVDRIQYRSAAEGIFAEFSLNMLAAETRFPFRLHLEQARVTPVMLERLRRHRHVDIAFDAELTDVALNEGSVTARVRQDGGEEVLEAAYLIGADGSRSQVRIALDIAFDGESYPDKVVRVMTDESLEGLMPGIAPLTYLFNGAKSVSFLRMADCWRIILRVPNEIDDESALAADWILARLKEVAPGCVHLPRVVMKDIYGVSKRVAVRYRAGRVYLVGDSAHVTNTRGGMNMNCGIHDAFAVARAMAEALHRNDPRLVDLAADERRRVATQFLIPRTDRNVIGGQAWLDKVKAMAANPEQALAYLRSSAMLDMVPDSASHL